jgi:hypothetical protein
MVTKMFKFGAVAAALIMSGAAYAQTPAGGADPYNASQDRMEGRSDAGGQPHRGINGPKPGDRSPGQRAAPAEKNAAP